jgi:TRAP-type C4-dicarboxylate transport system permease small subunit
MTKTDIVFNRIKYSMEVLLVLLFGLLVIDVLWQVFSRYFLKGSYSFTEELARFLLIWLSVLGAAYLNARREHLSMDFIYARLSERNQLRLSVFSESVIFLFAFLVMLVGGSNLVYITMHLDQLSGTLQVPLGYVYSILPVSGFLIMCFSIYHIRCLFRNPKEATR